MGFRGVDQDRVSLDSKEERRLGIGDKRGAATSIIEGGRYFFWVILRVVLDCI